MYYILYSKNFYWEFFFIAVVATKYYQLSIEGYEYFLLYAYTIVL